MKSNSHRRIRIFFWTLATLLGLAQAWVSRLEIVNDTISYLDMGDYFFHGHPAAIINGIWSPLYAFILGATLAATRPSPYMEYPTVHLLLFFVFLFTLACFDFFIRQLMLLHESMRSSNGLLSGKSTAESDWPWIAIAYTVFLWSSLTLIGVYETNPDMLIAAFFYLSCGLLVRIYLEKSTWKTFLGLGITLGLGYLTKGIMFPLGLLLLATAWPLARKKSGYVFVSLAAFALIAAPFIIALSIEKGHATVGETGGFNYAVHVNGVALHHWQGGTPDTGVPVHPTRQVFAAPAAFEFNGPLPGTYPAWYDPTFWYAGAKPHFQLREQSKAIARNLFDEFKTVFYALNGVLFATLFLAFYEARDKFRVFENISRCWFLIIPSALGVGLYVLVHVEARYVGPFLAVLGACLFSCILWSHDSPNSRLSSGIAALQLGFLLWLIAVPLVMHLRHPWGSDKGSYQDVAASAMKMGLHPGDQIASLNFSNLGTAMWARLARVRIVAEVYYWPGGPEGSENCFWNADPAIQEKLLERFSQAGARAVVSSDAPTGPEAGRWSRVGNTGYYLRWLNPPTLASQGS